MGVVLNRRAVIFITLITLSIFLTLPLNSFHFYYRHLYFSPFKTAPQYFNEKNCLRSEGFSDISVARVILINYALADSVTSRKGEFTGRSFLTNVSSLSVKLFYELLENLGW